MKNFINLKDIPAKDLRKILNDAKKRKNKRKKLSNIDVDKDQPLKGKLIIQMFEKQSSRTRLSFHLAIAQLGGGTITIKANELHLGKGGESLADTAKILSTSSVFNFFLLFFLFFASLKIFLKSFVGISLRLIKFFIITYILYKLF